PRGDAVLLGDDVERLALPGLEREETDPGALWKIGEANGEAVGRTLGQANPRRVARRRHATQYLWIQLANRFDGRVRRLRDRRERRAAADARRIVRERRQRAELHAVPRRLLRDQRRGDQLRHVLARLVAQIILFRQGEEEIFARRAL